jgi:hypothetical protein
MICWETEKKKKKKNRKQAWMWAALASATRYKTPLIALFSSLQQTSREGYLKRSSQHIVFVVWLSPTQKHQAPLYVEFGVSSKKP